MTTRIRRTKADENRDFGWWKAVARERMLVNRVSGQRVRRVGRTQDADAPADQVWLRFEYEDKEGVRFPLLVRQVELRELGCTWRRGANRQALVVDYERSAALWRHETGAAADYPSYGLWCRVDDCITDALPCWPRMTSQDRILFSVFVVGGWLNGTWRSDFRRAFFALDRKCFEPGSTHYKKYHNGKLHNGGPVYKAECPTLLPLDMAPPPPWRFHPFSPKPVPDGGTQPGMDYNVRFANERQVVPFSSHGLTVPPELPLTGFEGRTPYMRSIDGRRVVFVSSAHFALDISSRTSFTMQYGDDVITATITGTTSVDFDLRRLDGELRCTDGKLDADFFVRKGVYARRDYSSRNKDVFEKQEKRFAKEDNINAPSHALYQRLARDLVDAWLFWEGTPYGFRFLGAPLNMTGSESVRIQGGYFGGVWPAGGFGAWLAKGNDPNYSIGWWEDRAPEKKAVDHARSGLGALFRRLTRLFPG